jgi:DNA-directed RNA polymerase subunit H (RpoH/RPB5)
MDTETWIFEDSVNCWVLDAITSGVTTFDQLVTCLPGVYPSVVLSSLQRLASAQKIPTKVMEELIESAKSKSDEPMHLAHQIPLPVPHPLDYDWRFSDAAVENLLNECKKLTPLNSTIVLIGTPSLLRMGIEQSYPRQLLLLEASPTITASLTQAVPLAQVVRCDVIKEPLPKLGAEAVVLDPPWYPEHIHSFLWAACQLCKIGGHILISMPPFGTRPSVEREWMNVLDWAEKIGLTLVRLDKMALPYVSPPFEVNVLKAQGLHAVSKEWRRGNLAVFKCTHQTSVPRPTVLPQEDEWVEEVLSEVRLRIRQPNSSAFADPSLLSIVPGDVLQSVSRRDKRRQLADVWTSGNRIFACQGRGVLLLILQAIAAGRSPNQLVALALERSLTSVETELVSHAANQIINIVSIEQKENLLFGEQQNDTLFSRRAS